MPRYDFDALIAIVTGAGREIGRAIARRLADVADMVAFLASSDASYLTGQTDSLRAGVPPY